MFTDLHLHPFAQFSKPDPEFGSNRVANQVRSLRWVRDLVEEHKPDMPMFGGDFVEDRKKIDWDTYNRGYREILTIAQLTSSYGGELSILKGNHDTYGFSSHQSAIYPISGIHGVRIFDKPEVWNRIRFLPYLKGKPSIDSEVLPIGFAHLSVVELKINGSSHGGCPIDDLGCEKIFSGHYHVASTWESRSGRVLEYVGAILPRNFSDTSLSHFGATLIEWDEKLEIKVTRFANPHAWRFHKVDLDRPPTITDLHLPPRLYLHFHVPSRYRKETEDLLKKSLSPSLYQWSVWDSRKKKDLEEKVSVIKSSKLSDTDVLTAYVQRHGEKSEQQALVQLGMELLNGTFAVPR
jgi:DNA repair exonuclease SbcCD nuclease subunit